MKPKVMWAVVDGEGEIAVVNLGSLNGCSAAIYDTRADAESARKLYRGLRVVKVRIEEAKKK